MAEGQSLADILGGGDKALPWNVAWSGQPVSTPAEGGGVELTGPGLPKVTLLSPTPDRLADLYKVWAKELERLRRKERDRAEQEPTATRGELPSIEALAARVTPTDKAVPNGSSIAMLLEHQGASVLLSADAFPTVLVPALAALARRRGITGPVPVDAVKLTLLTREYRGVAYRVAVTADGQYEFEGRMFPSLSMIAREITGTRWSGPVFFGIKPISTPKQKAKKGVQR